MSEHIPYSQYDPGDVPEDFRQALDEAASLCKRLGHNLVTLPHVLSSLLNRIPDGFADAFRPDQIEAAKSQVRETLEAGDYLLDGTSIRLDQRLATAVAAVSAKGAKAPAEFVRGFLVAVETEFPGGLAQFAVGGRKQPDHDDRGGAGKADNKGPTGESQRAASAATEPAPGRTGSTADRTTTEGATTDRPAAGRSATPTESRSGKPRAEAGGNEKPGSTGGAAKPDAAAGGGTGRAAPIRVPYTIPWTPELVAAAPTGLYGREQDVSRVVLALLCREDPAVVLAGQPGCGKTAFLMGMAKQVYEGRLPALQGYEYVALDVPAVLTAATTGGVDQAKFAEMLGKIAEQPQTIFIVEDLHVLLGVLGPPMLHDLAALFKPHLLRGSLRVVFTTEPKLYDRFLTAEPVYSSHTTLVILEELSGAPLQKTVGAGVLSLYARHQITILPEAVDEAVKLGSEQSRDPRPPAACLRMLDIACIQAKLTGRTEVTADNVRDAAVTHDDKLAAGERSRLRTLEKELARWVVGQEEAVRAVAQRVRLTKLQLDRKPQRPDGVFLFLGPSGVGKTEMAKAVTHCLYGDLSRLVRLDMSEYMERHEYSKVIGAPPGYIGYGEEGHLTGPIARLGHGVVLLDEIEKAHPSVLRIFLQLFDEGFLTDGKGKRIDFSRTVVIMTSNLGRELYAEGQHPLGFMQAVSPNAPKASETLQYLLKHLPSEFVNRIDVLVPFRALERGDLAQIARKMLDDEVQRWVKRGKHLTYDERLVAVLCDRGYDSRLGARHLTRNVEQMVNQPLSEAACGEKWPEVRRVHLNLDDKSAVGLELDGVAQPASTGTPV